MEGEHEKYIITCRPELYTNNLKLFSYEITFIRHENFRKNNPMGGVSQHTLNYSEASLSLGSQVTW